MKKKILLVLTITAVIVIASGIPVYAQDQLAKLDAGGNRILIIVRRIGYWIILIKAIGDVIKAGLNGDKHAMGQIIMTYLLIYGALFFLPWALKLVEGIF
ncbi:MAG TPA: hypothetical protein VD757_02660 [Candidatus Nitrosocosmicus sp.]|nr:hypothetical protein [Candidatus Nitrosocosmicus sp.]